MFHFFRFWFRHTEFDQGSVSVAAQLTNTSVLAVNTSAAQSAYYRTSIEVMDSPWIGGKRLSEHTARFSAARFIYFLVFGVAIILVLGTLLAVISGTMAAKYFQMESSYDSVLSSALSDE
jgi:hypothetical protein